MHDFHFQNNELYCERLPVSDIARATGTPFYLYSYKTLTDHFQKIQNAFAAVAPVICFAMKANGNLAVLKALVNAGAGLDIVSGGELQKALKVQADPRKIVFASVGKTDEEIRAALRAGILFFNVESAAELDRINHIAKGENMSAPIAIRINPDVEATTHEFITTGTLKNKFGIDLTSARELLRKSGTLSHTRIIGLHIHIGSQIVTSEPFIKAITRMTNFIEELRAENIPIEYLDIGGGLGIIYKDEKPQTAQEFAEAVLPCLKKTGLKIVMEPGRFIAGNAGIFVTKVLYFKDNGYKKFLIVDGGMNDLIRPSFYGAYHEIVPVQGSQEPTVQLDVVGPICESGDFLGKARQLPMLAPGELLAVMSAGAYGFVMSSNYNARCRVPEIMVKGDQFAVVKERETFEDLIRGETIPEFL
ncbi:MAG TPA: diaminopimelate decarboxylase [Candidatus Omnitrophota bacterium]|nr:diaminopimelate decarboxylase [Candidatus Omnitrophota bacterium]